MTINYKGAHIEATQQMKLGGVAINQWPVLDADVDTIHANIMLNAFRVAVNGGLSRLNMVDGFMDEFEDETGIDTADSVNESYDSTNDSYQPARSKILTSGGTATAQGYSSPSTPAKGFDGDDSSNGWWWDNNTSGWLQMDFGAGNSEVVSRIQFKAAHGTWGGAGIKNFTFEGSHDASSWDILLTALAADDRTSFQQFDFQNAKGYRYYRINISDSYTSHIGLWELELHGFDNAFESETSLLLHGKGVDASTDISDASFKGHDVSTLGNARIDTAQSKFGGGSILFDGTGDFLSVPAHSDFDFGSGDWTTDFWIRLNDEGKDYSILSHDNGSTDKTWNVWLPWQGVAGSYKIRLTYSTDGTNETNLESSTLTMNADTWYHIEVTRATNTVYFFLDGVAKGTADITGVTLRDDTGNDLYIGCWSNGLSRFLDGWLEEIRISKGTARHTSAFTPETVPYENGFNMSLLALSETAASQPDEAHLILFQENSILENTDLKGWVTRDAGRDFTTDSASDDKLDLTAHGFSEGDRVTVFSSTTLPAGLLAGQLYFVINTTANDFELATVSGGAALDITDNGSGTHKVVQWDQATLADEGDYETNKRVLSGTKDISGQPAGTDMKFLVTTHNNRAVKLHGAALEWK